MPAGQTRRAVFLLLIISPKIRISCRKEHPLSSLKEEILSGIDKRQAD
jgi:hypothetical protein